MTDCHAHLEGEDFDADIGPVREHAWVAGVEPANIVYSRDFIAEVQGLSPELVDEVTTANARRLFSRLVS